MLDVFCLAGVEVMWVSGEWDDDFADKWREVALAANILSQICQWKAHRTKAQPERIPTDGDL